MGRRARKEREDGNGKREAEQNWKGREDETKRRVEEWREERKGLRVEEKMTCTGREKRKVVKRKGS